MAFPVALAASMGLKALTGKGGTKAAKGTRFIQKDGKIYKLVSPSARLQKRRRYAPRGGGASAKLMREMMQAQQQQMNTVMLMSVLGRH